MRLATGAQHPHVHLVLLERHRLVHRRRGRRHQLGGGLDGQVVVGVVEEGKGEPLRCRVHRHSVLDALVGGIRQHLHHRASRFVIRDS